MRSFEDVFTELDLSTEEESEEKSNIAEQILQIMLDKGMSQADACTRFGISKAKVSLLVKGYLMEFSMEQLFGFLKALED